MSDLSITLLDGTQLKAGDAVMALVPGKFQTSAKERRWKRTVIREVLKGGGVDRAVVDHYGILSRYNLKAVRRASTRANDQ